LLNGGQFCFSPLSHASRTDHFLALLNDPDTNEYTTNRRIEFKRITTGGGLVNQNMTPIFQYEIWLMKITRQLAF